MSGIFGDREEVRGPGGGEEERQEQPKERKIEGTGTSTVEDEFGFPILDPTVVVQMKNIPPSTLPNFHGMITKTQKLFFSNLMCYVTAMIILLMLKN
jgi:hypothetical protein